MSDTLHLTVDLQVDSESISGSAESPGGEPTAFDGWLGLISIIERVQANLGGPETGGANAPEPELPPATRSDGRVNQEEDHEQTRNQRND